MITPSKLLSMFFFSVFSSRNVNKISQQNLVARSEYSFLHASENINAKMMQKFHNYKINVNFMYPIPYDLFNKKMQHRCAVPYSIA